VSGTFDCDCNLPLVFGTGAGLPPGADFSFPVDERGKELGISIVDFQLGIRAELTRTRAGKIPAPTAASSATPASSLIRHLILLVNSLKASCFLLVGTN